MSQSHSSASVSRDSVTMSRSAQNQDPETQAAEWNSDIIHFIVCLFFVYFLFLACENVLPFLPKNTNNFHYSLP